MVAVDSVSFSLDAGQTLAIVGESGSGKSAMVRTIMGLYRPGPSFRSRGAVILDGTDIAGLSDRDMVPFRGRQIGMIFQDPMSSLNPVKKIGPQISEVLILKLGMDRKAARLRAIELLELVGMSAPEQRYDQYPMHLSGGMRQRVAIAIAIAPEPKVLIADEPTTALDVTVQAQILELLFRLQQDRRMALLLISHNLAMVAGHSDRTMVMYAGSVVEIGPTAQVVHAPRMPYTRALLDAAPSLTMPPHSALRAIPGTIPNMVSPPRGCRFQNRCWQATDACGAARPGLERLAPDHFAACISPLALDRSS